MNQIALILFILTEGLVVYSNLQFYYSLFFVLRSLKTAVNSICLGTCSSCFFVSFDHSKLCVSKGAKYNFFVSQVFFEFWKISFSLFSSYSPFNQRHHLLNLSKNLFPFVGKDNYFISQIFFTFKDIFIRFHYK
jgi:hypothetical protein